MSTARGGRPILEDARLIGCQSVFAEGNGLSRPNGWCPGRDWRCYFNQLINMIILQCSIFLYPQIYPQIFGFFGFESGVTNLIPKNAFTDNRILPHQDSADNQPVGHPS